MKWSMATVSFRYSLYSFEELLELAKASGFQGVELWEPHLLRSEQDFDIPQHHQKDIHILVLSGYMDLTNFSNSYSYNWLNDIKKKLEQCQSLHIPLLRLFSGSLSSHDMNWMQWKQWLDRVNQIDTLAKEYNVQVVFETHPNTLLDDYYSVCYFVDEIEKNQWNHIGINFDTFHVWEFGKDPLDCLKQWYPHVKHVHLKNAKQQTNDFVFSNIYHPIGNYRDLCSISEGIVDTEPLVKYLQSQSYDAAATLEWFGHPDLEFMKNEIRYLNEIIEQQEKLVVQFANYYK
ncbi:sugar phosphate isomerase/epimerase family protein [Alteribacillus bidgolensis]|uniref:Sugar phosphate isomerase/epimerase n=1 Tax=Alteribacillus bidgolensis TaxID=930129 RepID=A0A1G8RIB6_9BACI|nr:sugar phosphate isomerase/epimerase [Alteribacillus bidgolensis]SDJ16804.1 Sugar phosphate isomerase/epimerase [Alteribacillus bidgolensis]